MKRVGETNTKFSAPVRAAQTNFRVLVIDENPADRELAGAHLSAAWPFEHELVLDYAGDGQEALEKLQDIRFTLIVLDWMTPVVSGEQLLRELRQRGIRIPIIVMSGLKRESIPADLDSLGAVFLGKNEMNPITVHEAIATSLRLLGVSKPA